MEGYINSIEQAVYLFPFVVALIAIPYFYYEFKKYGQIELKKSILTFTFILYLICCYCLTILPIPSYEEVMAMEGPYTDFRFLGFLSDFINYSDITLNPDTWLNSLESVWFYIPFFNFVMLIPFGIYQKRLFHNSLLKSTIYALLITLSFELIQLSGLFGIFPHPYRLFQIDDIFLNTFGSIIGWLITPKVKQNEQEKIVGTVYSPKLKGRFITFILDLIFVSFLIHIYSLLFGFDIIGGNLFTQYIHYLVIGILYFIILSWFLEQRTPAGYLLDYTYRTRYGRKVNLKNFILRQLSYFGIVLPLPYFALYLFRSDISIIITIPVGIIALLIPIIVIIQVCLNLPPFYESFSNTYLTDRRKLEKFNQSRQV